MPVPQYLNIFSNRQDACSTISQHFCGTGILPVLTIGATPKY
jgi:hypothetical protein